MDNAAVAQPTPESDTEKSKKDYLLQARDEQGRFIIPES